MSNDKRKSDRETHDKAIGKEHRSTGWIKKISIVFLSCVLALTLATPMLHAEDLEIGPEIIGQPVRAVKPPIVNIVSIGDKTVSGKLTIGAGQRKSRKLDVTIRVIVNRKAGGTEEKTVTIPYTKSSQDWTVTLGLGSELAEGDKVTVTQEAGGEISKGVVREAKKSLSDQHKDELKMPSGEIWLENPDANLVNKDERAEAIEMLKKANPDIVNDFDLDPEKTKFSNDGPAHAYYEVTYTDGSTSGKIEATDLKIKKVTETSVAPTIEKVQVTDGQIIVTLDKEVAAGTKFYFIKNIDKQDYNNFCKGGNCKVDKSNSQEMSQAVSVDGKKVTFPINDDDLELEKEFGIVVKEPHKFRSCAKSEPVVTTPEKVAVRDPRKLTDADKQSIDKAIRDANTVNGVSKLPDGTGDNDGTPAFIEFDKDGNVTIISPNDVEVTWDSNFNPVYVKNPDGTYKLKSGRENNVTKFPAKDLVKNIAPKSPAISVDTDKGEVTITPPAYENPGEDTDLASYTITYKNASGAEQTVTATRDLQSNKWRGPGVDENTGVITLKVEDIEVGGTVNATATDNGGLEGDTNPLKSDLASAMLETANVTYDPNQGSGTMEAKKLNKGSKYKILDNKFEAPENQKFRTWKIGDTEYSAGDEITVKEDTTIQAIWQESGVTVSYNANGGSGSMDSATMKKGSTYKLSANKFTAPENKEFKGWKIGDTEYAEGAEITVNEDTTVEAVWKDIMVDINFEPGEGSGTMDKETVKKGSTFKLPPSKFEAPKDMEFKGWKIGDEEKAVGDEITINGNTTVTAVWKKIQVKVTYDANGGSGEMKGATVDKGSTYKLLASTFTAPENQEFKTWEIDGKEVAPDTEITVTKDTVVKAVWKDIMVDINFEPGEGTGTMDKKTVKKGSAFKLPPSKFEAPKNKEFKGWKIGETEYQVGDEITVNGNTTVKAIWKEMVTITYNPNGGKWNDGKTESIRIKYDKGIEITIKEAPTRDGYKFLYWKGSEYQPGQKYTANEDHTFVAQWEPSPVVPPVIGGINPRDIPPKYVVTPQGSMQPAPSASTPRVYKTLPRTGESNGLPLMASALLALLGGALILSRKRS